MRVLLDVSWLGLGHRYAENRRGAFRANQELARALVQSDRCEVLLCANLSSVAFAGCEEYLLQDRVLCGLPLLGPRSGSASMLRGVATRAHAVLRGIFPGKGIPVAVRAGARLLDQRAHRPVGDADPPADVFHSLCSPLPPRARPSQRRLLTLFDIVHPRYAHLYGRNRVQSTAQAIASLTPEDWVVTSSEATRADLVELGVANEDRVFITSLAADPDLFHPCCDAERLREVRQRLGVPPGPYLLAVGPREAHKNLEAVLRAFVRLVRQENAPDLTLVFAGQPGGRTEPLDLAIADARSQGARVVLTGFVPDDDLAPLYSAATGFVTASLHEGFGLPVLEAMRCGTPVIASNRGSVPEVAGEAAIVVDPEDADALAQAMLDLYHSSALRERLRTRGHEWAAGFTWARTAEETLAAYRRVLDA